MRRRTWITALCLVALGTALSGHAGVPTRLEPAAADLERSREDWYGIYSGESKLGYLHNKLERDPETGRLVVENEMHLKVVALGERREVRSRERLQFAPEAPWRLVSGAGATVQGPFRQEVELAVSESGTVATIRAGGTERTLPVEALDYTLADVLTPELWFRSPREPGQSFSARSFSLTDITPALDTYTVEGRKRTRLDGIDVSYYEVALHSSIAGAIGTALIDAEGRLVSGVLGGTFELRRESEALATDFDYTADVYLLGLAEVDTPLGDPARIRSLRLRVDGERPEAIPSSGRQGLSFDADSGAWHLQIGDGAGTPPQATADEIRAALQESVEHPIRDDRIVALANEAIDGATDPWDQVRALVSFVDTFVVDSYSAEPLTVLDMLAEPRGDCTEHALLFTTLARALGIPTREITGLLYLGDDVQAFGGHAWNEVVLDGEWHPVDATWGEVLPNATHIRLGTRLGEDASLANLFAGYSFGVVEIERD